MKKIITSSPEETRQIAKRLASKLNAGDVLALEGELGSGKTQFVQGLAQGFGVPGKSYVRSPTFTLLNEYCGRLTLYHFDFYRLRSLCDLNGLGLEEYIDGNGVTVIEWAERFPQAFPERTIHIKFEIIDEKRRKLQIKKRSHKHLPFVRGG